jgi:hypothetical protein
MQRANVHADSAGLMQSDAKELDVGISQPKLDKVDIAQNLQRSNIEITAKSEYKNAAYRVLPCLVRFGCDLMYPQPC